MDAVCKNIIMSGWVLNNERPASRCCRLNNCYCCIVWVAPGSLYFSVSYLFMRLLSMGVRPVALQHTADRLQKCIDPKSVIDPNHSILEGSI